MFDDDKLPTSARDFTRGIFKGGDDQASLYRRIAYGMPGTPMPSSTKMTTEQMVDLVHYIRSLSDESARKAAVLSRERIVARRVDGLPQSGDDKSWAAVPATRIRLTPLWWRNDFDPQRDGVDVQAVHDGKSLVVRLSWQDATENSAATATEAFEDGTAMELFGGDAEPFIGMGGPKSPVDVWYWDADRQFAPDALASRYPNAVVDRYPFSEKAAVTAEFNRPGTKSEQQPDISLPARASGNPIVPDGKHTASALTTGGPGSATFRMPKSQLVTAHGTWSDGQWTVVMTRRLKVESEDDGVSLEPGERVSAAFAVWDGAHRDRDGQKLISIWQDLELEK